MGHVVLKVAQRCGIRDVEILPYCKTLSMPMFSDSGTHAFWNCIEEHAGSISHFAKGATSHKGWVQYDGRRRRRYHCVGRKLLCKCCDTRNVMSPEFVVTNNFVQVM